LTAALAFLSIGTLDAQAKDRKKAKPAAFSVTVRPSKDRIVVSVKTRAAATCGLTVRRKTKSATFPKVKTNKKHRVSFGWAVPADAPSGTWTFTTKCTTRGKSVTVRKTALIVTKGTGKGGLADSGSFKPVEGGLGGKGIGPCAYPGAPDQNGKCVSFPGNPFNNYEGGTDIGQCTWYAAGRRPDVWGIATGNAKDWLTQTRGKLPQGSTPAVGAIAVRTAGLYGHVAIVVAVNGSSVLVDDANYYNDVTVRYRHTVPAGYFQGYIYGGAANGGATGGSATPPTGTATTDPALGTNPGASGAQFDYFVGNDGSLRVSHWTGSQWQLDNLSQGVLSGTSPSAYLGPNGTHWVYFVGNDGTLRVTHWTGSQWQTDNLSQGVLAGTSPSAYLGPNGTHYVYFVGNDGVVRLTHWTGSEWRTDNFGAGAAGGSSPSAYLAPNGEHFFYFVGNDGALRVAHFTSGNWRIDNLAQGVLSGTSPSAYVGPNGTHYVYFVGNDGVVRLTHWTGSEWRTDNFGAGAAGGSSPSAYLG
jgi:hypothetical protein